MIPLSRGGKYKKTNGDDRRNDEGVRRGLDTGRGLGFKFGATRARH